MSVSTTCSNAQDLMASSSAFMSFHRSDTWTASHSTCVEGASQMGSNFAFLALGETKSSEYKRCSCIAQRSDTVRPEKVASGLSAASSSVASSWAGKSLRLQERLKLVTEASSTAASRAPSVREIVLSMSKTLSGEED